MSTLTYKNLQVRYEFFPCQRKPAGNIVLLHSLGLALEESESFLPYFLSAYNVLRYDILGHGQSGLPSEPITADLLVDQLDYMTRHFFKDKFYIVAGPGIGYIASRFCRAHDAFVSGLVMISPPPAYLSLGEKQQIMRQIETIMSNGFHAFKKFLLSHFTINQEQSIVCRLEDQLNQTAEHVHLGLIYAWLDEDYSSDIRYIDTPILLLAGTQDTLFPSSTYGMTANYMKAEFIMIPAAAHLVTVDNPEASADAVLKFIASIESGKPAEKGFYIRKEELAKALYNGFEQVDKESNPTMRVQLLHTFRIHISDVEVTHGWNMRKVKSLFLYLLFHGTVTREEIIEVFWSELPMHSAQNQLRMNLHYLKSLLNQAGIEFLHKDREQVFLQGNIQCDAIVYVNQLHEAYAQLLRGDLEIRNAQRILEISPQKLLSYVYDDWYLQLRDAIETQFTALCHWTAGRLRALEREGDAAKYERMVERLTT